MNTKLMVSSARLAADTALMLTQGHGQRADLVLTRVGSATPVDDLGSRALSSDRRVLELLEDKGTRLARFEARQPTGITVR